MTMIALTIFGIFEVGFKIKEAYPSHKSSYFCSTVKTSIFMETVPGWLENWPVSATPKE